MGIRRDGKEKISEMASVNVEKGVREAREVRQQLQSKEEVQ